MYFKHLQKKTESLDEIIESKNELYKKAKQKDTTEEDKLAARKANFYYNYLLKLKEEKDRTRLAVEQEKSYKKDFWNTAQN